MRHVAGKREGGGNSERAAHEGEAQALAENEPQNVAVLRSERHAETDFICALGNGVGHHSVDSDDGESEGGRREDSEKRQIESLVVEGSGKDMAHGKNLRYRKLIVDGPEAFFCL